MCVGRGGVEEGAAQGKGGGGRGKGVPVGLELLLNPSWSPRVLMAWSPSLEHRIPGPGASHLLPAPTA